MTEREIVGDRTSLRKSLSLAILGDEAQSRGDTPPGMSRDLHPPNRHLAAPDFVETEQAA